MSQDRIRLLEHLAYDHFGSAVGEVASLLLKRGALPFSHLLRLSSLPPVVLYQSLLILSLHSCLYHSESEINSKLSELYEINDIGLERRLRGSVYLHMAEDIFDKNAGMVIEMLWKNGMCKPSEMASLIAEGIEVDRAMEDVFRNGSEEAKERKKGKGKAETESEEALEIGMQTVQFLHRNGYISIITPGSQLSPLSLEIKWEEELRSSIKGIPTGKQQKEIKEDLLKKQLEWTAEERLRARGKTPGDEVDEAPKRRMKKKKRVSMYDEEEAEVVKNDYEFQEDAWYKINAERFHIRWRSELIQKYAEQRYNKEAAIVMSVILQSVEGDVDTMEDPESKPVSINEITRRLNNLETPPALVVGLEKKEEDQGFELTTLSSGQLAQEYLRILSCDDDFSMDRARAFLRQFGGGDGAGAKYSVPYNLVGAKMKRALVEAMIEDIASIEGVRCWRILEQKGKLEEKHLAKLAFLSVKQCREIIGKLSSANLIEPQEVPKSAERAPSRTFYLWFVDYAKAINSLLGHLYKALANLQAQKQYQLSLRKTLVTKRERSDVRADPDNLLTPLEKEGLEGLDRALEALTVAEMRIDQDVFVLRELDPF